MSSLKCLSILFVAYALLMLSCKSQTSANKATLANEKKDTLLTKDTNNTIKGHFVYMADLALFTFCGTNIQIPVAMENNYINAEKAYTSTKHKAMEPLYMELIGSIANRDNGEGKMMPHLIVEKFISSDLSHSCE
jgi:copper homeostasis protein (lipoprotein)